jgi:hypothetical protein
MLSSHEISRLRTELKSNIYTNSQGISSWIKASFGVSYTPQGVVELLNRIGFTYKKTKEVPCESSAQKQETFVSELSEIIVGMDKRSVIYYAGGVHPTHYSRSTYAWIEKGQEPGQPTVSGRYRENINGLFKAKDVTDVIAHECESVNAESAQTLYLAASDKHSQAECIYIISDNAKYYGNKALIQWPEGTGIRQLFLPAYSPNLNR